MDLSVEAQRLGGGSQRALPPEKFTQLPNGSGISESPTTAKFQAIWMRTTNDQTIIECSRPRGLGLRAATAERT